MQQENSHIETTPDKLQREAVAAALLNFIRNTFARESINWDWNRLAVKYEKGTRFDTAHRSAATYLSQLINRPEFLKMLSSRNISRHQVFQVDENARIYYTYTNISSVGDSISNQYFSPKDITSHVTGIADINNDLRLIANIAKLTGGLVTSGENIAAGQWLRFHELPTPTNEEDTKALIDLINAAFLPVPLPFGNFWQLLDAPEDSPYKLTPQRRETIREVTRTRFTGDEMPLVELFGNGVRLLSGSADKLPASTGYRLETLISSATIDTSLYLEALDWFSAETDPVPTKAFQAQLMIAAMLIDLDADVDIDGTKFAGFDLYSADHVLRRPADVRQDFEKHLQKNANVSDIIAPLVAEMALGGMAPEYLVRDLPADLKLATPGWVVFCQAVQFVETLAPGASRNMSYQHVLRFSQVAELTPDLKRLRAQNAFDPVVTWALMNKLINRDSDGSLSQDVITRGIDEYQRYVDQITNAANKLVKPFPDRRTLALKELKKVAPDCNPEELLVNRFTPSTKVSIIDLYLGDELHTEHWGRTHRASIHESIPQLRRLYPVPNLFDEATHDHYTGMVEATASNINIALSQLTIKDREFIENGHLALYAVQVYNRETTRPSGYPGVNSTIGVHAGETYRFGMVIGASLNSTVRCYELFPLRAQCRFNERLTTILSPLVLPDGVRYVETASTQNAPIDLKAYSANEAPEEGKTGRFFIKKIGDFEPSSLQTDDSGTPNRYFRSSRKEAISALIAKEIPVITQEEIMAVGRQQTEREKAIEKSSAIFNTILNIIIPFKECVEALASGDAGRQARAVPGCLVDALAFAGAFVAVPGKIAASVAKTATLGTKLLSASRIVGRSAISFLNPLDGVPTLLKGGAKLIGRSATKLGSQAASAAHVAKSQLLHLTGANSYDLLRAVDHTGSATRIRMSLDTVSHARALFKDDSITSIEQVMTRLNDRKIPKGASAEELQHLFDNSIKDAALQSKEAQMLGALIGETAVHDVLASYSANKSIRFTDERQTAQRLAETLAIVAELEAKKVVYLTTHQQNLLKLDLGQAPYHAVLPESVFNPNGFTDPAQRAAAWMANGAFFQVNDVDQFTAILREYAGNNKLLTDPTVITELNSRLAPSPAGQVRQAGQDGKYGGSITGFALLEQHLKTLDTAHQHIDKHLLASVIGFQSFADGNGRTASALYAITQLRSGQFTPLTRQAVDALSGIR
ncbi:hypothetical protein FQ192_09130 [Pseudomonas sp. ANT_J12]|uniref:hypothetical protein n=1 Tax=Pseudomonas sp. ANT_J12 TaxID=2597351 RepID=UPI0011F10FD3|nr:hypothetical protein [Pseudomonas sp. ANT_J12]KAA0995209.1 hypothetical protein FQ192_09130 [Pseudomonas sp. ANT_J12]